MNNINFAWNDTVVQVQKESRILHTRKEEINTEKIK